MKIIENINTVEKTSIVFHGGNLKERNDVSFFEDLDLLTKELFKIKILQNPITNINVELIYDAEMHDPGEAMREELKIEPFDEDLEHQMDLMLEGGTLNDVAMYFDVDLAAVQSNMVFISCEEGKAQDLVENVSKYGVDVLTIGDSIVRAVVHLHITDQDIENTISAFENAQ